MNGRKLGKGKEKPNEIKWEHFFLFKSCKTTKALADQINTKAKDSKEHAFTGRQIFQRG